MSDTGTVLTVQTRSWHWITSHASRRKLILGKSNGDSMLGFSVGQENIGIMRELFSEPRPDCFYIFGLYAIDVRNSGSKHYAGNIRSLYVIALHQ